MTRVLIVEDEPDLADPLAYLLRREGFEVEIAEDGGIALDAFTARGADIVLLDLMLPGMPGTEVCRIIRTTSKVPIIMLTARSEEADRIRGLSTGADDYVVKPFSLPELMARVKALLRRASPSRIAEVLVVADVSLDRAAHRVLRGKREVRLGPTEFRLLEYFMEKPGRVFTRAQLLDSVWGMSAEIDERTVDVHVGRLRKALIRGREKDPIRTVRGAGYSFDETFGHE